MDITKIKGVDLGIEDVEQFTYLLTYSFPCQDLSVAGLGKGMSKGSGTRSGLLWEVERLLNEVENLPQILLMENVPQVHGKRNINDFQKWIDFLTSKGYSNYWQDLNAMDFGVAQKRDRCFMISILGNYKFTFPTGIPLNKVMKDYLDDVVDEKYYIKSEKAYSLINELYQSGKLDDY
jgi:DNA (cytosine-5)-methyltransferase 1